ncbi:RNA polymerase I-specific transcription initiation factor RRN3 family protein [Aspergillus clavatus NRRL 1]|uniref:RNA polymerase I specific transcription initiation factor RRN3 superfamily n=1 Tax=Aspergillus clavatus (strain ATCC 1007 / CBS 513.65 / DSM 816 / NCTC 3887 / NRRL 1 / QM 1276 / 107) TaxID=344612 RepID=A1CS26_ASPCL|nr:RNA polymerase I-specific transcription initiation factor RRN3 family protein [Aspergillus clavatus NRRL 1]EAW08447.1 RNA polymerase I specific transcription initiation factor RRN3 superfamily [Aspergillus clavatus NRRL 1]
MVSFATVSRNPAGAIKSVNSSRMLASPSPVPILKTSKLNNTATPGRKHSLAEMELSLSPSSSIASDAGDVTPSPKKRARVQFDKDVEMREVSWSGQEKESTGTAEKSAAVVREEVRRAIQRHVSGADSEAYDRIKEIFSVDPRRRDEDGLLSEDVPTHTTLKHHLMGLLSNVASLDRSCNGLVNAVLNSEWLGRDGSYIKLYIRFLGNLAAAQGSYLGSVLKMLANHLGELPKGTGKLPGYAPVHAAEIYSRIHTALRHVMQLIPSGSGTLSPILSMQFPFDTDSAKANIAYTRNLLKVISYAPELQADILALITEKLVKIDVQIQIDMEDIEDEVGEDVLHAVSPEATMFEDEDDDEDDNASVASDESIDAESRRVKILKDNILKLDGMIDSLFEYYAPPFRSGTLDDKENALDLLLSHFQSIILPTYRSRHSQFLLFHFSQSSPILVDRFAATCVQLIFNKMQPGILRQSAAAYLASFVARGAHISGEVVRDVFDLLGTHLNNLRLDYEATCRGPDLRRYGPFYSTAQALLYIFCFRWRDLTTAAVEGDTPEQIDELEPEEIAFPPSVKEVLHQAIHSKLNPLKVCSPAIVSEFARMAQHLNFMYVFSILETNKRLRVSSFRNISAMADPRFSQIERETRAGDDLGYQLDAYFPFDPYQLPRSRRWLENDYVHWQGIPGLDDQDDDDSDSDQDSELEDDLSDVTETDEED